MYTIEDLVSLKQALISGASQTTIGDRTVTWRTVKELLELIKIVENDLAGNTPQSDNSVIKSSFDKKGNR